MRIIITGGTGLIGSALTQELLARGHEVIILSRNPSKARDLPKGARAERWDARTGEGWSDLCADAAIVNLAGENLAEGRWNAERKSRIRDSRINAGKAVVQAVEVSSVKPRVVIQASAVGYYGLKEHGELSESLPPGTDFLAGVCVDWEDSTAAVEAMGVRRAVIRTSPVMSLRGGFLPRMMAPYRFLIGGKLGSGNQWFPVIHIDDEVSAIRFLIENENCRGPFNLCLPQTVTNAQFSKALGRAMHRPSVFPTPAFLLQLLFGEMSAFLLGGQRAVPGRLLEQGFVFRFPDVESALRDLFKE